MAERSKSKIPSPYPPPPYTFYDAKERGEFLSEIGSISPVQREIFHMLCKTWQPEISHSRFLSQITGLIKNASAELEGLLTRLGEKKCAVLSYRYSDEEAVPDKIILTVPADCRYHYYLLRKELEIFYRDDSRGLPLEKTLGTRGFLPPPSCIEELDEEEYHRFFDERDGEDTSLFRLNLANAEALILPAGSGKPLMDRVLARIRRTLSDANMAAELARLTNTSLGDFKNRLESRDPLTWLETLKTVGMLKEDPLATKRVSAGPELFNLAEALGGLIDAYIKDQRLKKLSEEERRRDLEALALQMESEKDKYFSQERFDLLLDSLQDKYREDFPSLKEEFISTYVDLSEQYKMPPVARVAKGYLHRSNFYEFFLFRLFSFRETLEAQFIKDMIHLLRTNNRDRRTLFTSRESFETEIIERVQKMDPFLADLFEKPRLLSEAIIFQMREKQKVKDPALVSAELGKFFKLDTMRYRGLTTILRFSIVDIYIRAFSQLSFLRQIWMRLTGKYESYRSQFVSRSLMFPSSPQVSTTRRKAVREKTISGPGKSPQSNLGPSPRSSRTKAGSPKRPSYTKKQQESAWEEFSKTIRSKPQN